MSDNEAVDATDSKTEPAADVSSDVVRVFYVSGEGWTWGRYTTGNDTVSGGDPGYGDQVVALEEAKRANPDVRRFHLLAAEPGAPLRDDEGNLVAANEAGKVPDPDDPERAVLKSAAQIADELHENYNAAEYPGQVAPLGTASTVDEAKS